MPLASRTCPACGEDNGYPNVRLADSTEEKNALETRVKEAEASARAGGYLSVLNDLGLAVASSKAIIARPLVERLSGDAVAITAEGRLPPGARNACRPPREGEV